MIKNAKILVADDEPDFERLFEQRFKKQIKDQTYEFTYVSNGIEALEAIEKNKDFDLVLSDINMPIMDGITLLSKLKNTQPDLKIVMITAYSDMKNIRAAMNLGAYDFITKPINFTDLDTTIQKTLKEVEITRQAAKARELEIMNSKLRALDHMKTQFFTNISHEFRTPITIINGVANQIKEKPEQWLTRGVNMIKRNGNNLLYLVDQILDLAKLEEEKIQLQMVQGNVIEYLGKVAEPFHLLAERKNIRLEVTEQVPELIMDYDPEQLLKILSNLLSNAIKFNSSDGTVSLTLDSGPSELLDPSVLKTPAADNCLLIVVKDSGQGIPEEKLPFIFERFYQIDGSSTRNVEGTGIGLSIVKELVQLMEGKITVSSGEEGTTFQVALPVRRLAPVQSDIGTDVVTAAEHEAIMASVSLANQSSLDSILGINMQQSSILVIGDQIETDERLRIYLEGQYELILTKDLDKGISIAREEAPDLIILNMRFQEINSHELCDALKTDERTSHIPVLLLADKSGQHSRINGKENNQSPG